ncbi:hypothetical protein SFC66_12415 [Terribacillus saccharophilus]|uniref:hypothetical protein n=1 Tax=Terribacillus saccharophilus TaxID=361277 RepID=UPI00398201F4
MSKKKDYGMTEEELRKEEEERIQDSNDDYWLIPINEEKTLSELEDDFYFKQVKAEEAYWENRHLEQLKMEDSMSEDMEENLDEDDLEFKEEELDISGIELEDSSRSDGSIKRDNTYVTVDEDEPLEI